MSVNKIGMMAFSAFLIFATALLAPAQSTASQQDQTTKKQATTQQATPKGTASKDDLMSAQQALKDKGIYSGAVDGTMNADTQKALRDFQQKNNLKTTGTLNAETKTALGISHEHKATGTNPATKDTGKDTGKHKKTSGISNEKVRTTQTALKNSGFDPGPIDGIMGPLTMTALRNYQSHNGLEVTGKIDAETHNSLIGTTATRTSKLEKSDINRAPSEKPSVVSNPDDVRQIQQSLTDLMFNPGEVNGIMTSQTRQAIREFQWLNSLPVTGNIDEQTKMTIQSWEQPPAHYSPLSRSFESSSTREKPAVTSETLPATHAQYDAKPLSQNRTSTAVQNDTKTYKDSKPAKYSKDGAERIAKSADVLQDLTATADKKVPNELLERAEAIAVIPNMIKGAFGIGGRFGKGVVAQRAANGHWSAPSFLEIGGGSFGAQLGVSSTDLVLVFTDRKALSLLEGGHDLKLGVDAGVTAGPIGRSAEAGVNAKLSSAIYAYSRSKGLFAGVALDGAVLSIDKDMNEKVYGPTVNAEDILNGKTAINATVRPFNDVLNRVAPQKRLSQK